MSDGPTAESDRIRHAAAASPGRATVASVRRRLAPLRVRPFARLLVSYTVNDLGDVMAVVALSILVFDRTQSAVSTAGFFVAAKSAPAVLAPVFTARVDQL